VLIGWDQTIDNWFKSGYIIDRYGGYIMDGMVDGILVITSIL